MQKSKQIFIITVIVAKIMLIFMGCSFQNDSFSKKVQIKDISQTTEFADIVTKGFMGGSLIYNSKEPSLGQISDGVSVAIRLSRAESKEVGSGQEVFNEISGSALYGLLVVNEVCKDHIDFSTRLYNLDGNIISERNFILNENECADIDEDGTDDIEYCAPFAKRSGYEKAMYLNFLSSQKSLNITMYAVLTDQYPGKTYPNGVIGVNNDGRFLIQKYSDSENLQRSVVRGAYSGDYVLDNVGGTYQRITTNNYARNARSVSDDDLEDIQNEIATEAFYFSDVDFAYNSIDDFLSVLPSSIVEKYAENGIEKLNKILEDTTLIQTISEEQASILPEEGREEIFVHISSLSTEEIVQINRVFLEQNYPFVCPQRVTVSQAITEILPLASVVFTQANLQDNILEEIENYESVNTDSDCTSRAASASFSGAKDKADYMKKLGKLEAEFDGYNTLFNEDLNFPICKKLLEKSSSNLKCSIKITDSKIKLGITGYFSSTWGRVRSSLGAAVFAKIQAGVSMDVQHKNPYTESLSDTLTIVNSESEYHKKEGKDIFKGKVKLYEFNTTYSNPLFTFTIGPIPVGINLNINIGLPINLNFETDIGLSYEAYIAGLAQVGIKAGIDYGCDVRWKWIIPVPHLYANYTGDAFSSADAVYYVDTDFSNAINGITSLSLGLSVEPQMKFGLEANVAAVLHGGVGVSFGLEGYSNFKYNQQKVIGTLGLNIHPNVYAEAFIGIRGVKFLGINIGDLGQGWSWDLGKDKTIPIVPEFKFLEFNLK